MKFKAFSFYLKGLNVGRRLGHNPPGESTDLQEAQITHIQLCVVQCVCVCVHVGGTGTLFLWFSRPGIAFQLLSDSHREEAGRGTVL